MSFNDFIQSMAEGNLRQDVIGRNEWDGILVDTCYTNDTGKYETFIRTPKNSKVVEVYPNRKSSIIGHKNWVKLMKENPEIELKEGMSAIEWFFGEKEFSKIGDVQQSQEEKNEK